MKHGIAGGLLSLLLGLCLSGSGTVHAQAASQESAKDPVKKDELRLVVLVSRHGVRSPTGKLEQLNQYSRQPWPTWSVPPGHLTAHGSKLMTLLGAYDREQLASQGLLAASGCGGAPHIRIVADSDQRTRETGKALATGLAPGCGIEVTALPEGTPDPLFHSLGAGVGHLDKALAIEAIASRIGGKPTGLSEAYRPQLEALQAVLLGCNAGQSCTSEGSPKPQSIFDIPSSIAPGKGDHGIELRTPLSIAATMAENMLLEYTEGMNAANVGWGRVDIHKVRELVQLHTANVDIVHRTSYLARAESSNLLYHILRSVEQSVVNRPVQGALTKSGDRVLILVGHDTNIAAIAGTLSLSWLVDGRRDDTPPGGALVFELWKKHSSAEYSVRVFYMAQTLDQMRDATPLSLSNPPERVPVYVPGCDREDGSCEWETFQKTVHAACDTAFVH